MFTKVANIRFIVLYLFAFLALLLSGCGARPGAEAAPPPAQEEQPAVQAEQPAASTDVDVDCTTIESDLKLGMDGSITGGTADYGVNQSRGFQLAIYEYNLNGGYNGQPVACAIYDDATKAETGQENVTRMIEQDQVLGIIGAVNSGVTLGFSQQVQEAGVPLVVPISTATKITEQYPNPESFIFRISMPDVHQTDTVLAYAQAKGWNKIALLASTSGYGKAGEDDVVKEAAKLGVELVTVQNLDETDTDITAQVQAARDAGAQAIFTYALAPALANIIKSMDKVGFNVPVIGSWTLAQPQMRELAGEDLLEDFEVYMAQSYTIDQNDLARTLHKSMLEHFGEDPFPIAAGQTYDATRLMLKALDAAGPDRAKMRDALEQINDFQAATSAPAQPFSSNDHEGIEAKDIFVGLLAPVEGQLEVVQAQ